MINLFTSFYQDKSEVRQKELELCMEMNLRNNLIDKIYIFLEGDEVNFPVLNSEKIIIHNSNRPTYKMFFDLVNQVTQPNDINIISNIDIFFDESLDLLHQCDLNNKCYALSRWHFFENGVIKLHEQKFSQDTWIFKGRIKPIKFCNFNLGIRGCDNRIAWEIRQAGYRLLNPARSIKTIHYHISDLHNYGDYIVPKPHLAVELSHLTNQKIKT